MKYFLFSLIALQFSLHIVDAAYIVACHFDGRTDNINQIDPEICDHVYLKGFYPTQNPLILDFPDSYIISGILKLKDKNPALKIFATIYQDSTRHNYLSIIASDPHRTTNFAMYCLYVAIYYKFDGINIEWKDMTSSDSKGFSNLLTLLHEYLYPGGKYLAVTVTGRPIITDLMTISVTCDLVDFVNIEAFNYEDYYSVTDVIAPATKVGATIDLFISKNCPRKKMLLGITTRGFEFTLLKKENDGVGALIEGPINSIPYRDICQITWGWPIFMHDVCNFWTSGTRWITSENKVTASSKFNSFVKGYGLGGAYFPSTSADDYDNSCKVGAFPIISEVYQASRWN